MKQNFTAIMTGCTLITSGTPNFVRTHMLKEGITGTTLEEISGASLNSFYGYFNDTEQTDQYSLYFIFNATSVDLTKTTYEVVKGDSDYVNVYGSIYQFSDDYYAIRIIVAERYEAGEENPDTYKIDLHVATNDPDSFLNTTLNITHNFCNGL